MGEGKTRSGGGRYRLPIMERISHGNTRHSIRIQSTALQESCTGTDGVPLGVDLA